MPLDQEETVSVSEKTFNKMISLYEEQTRFAQDMCKLLLDRATLTPELQELVINKFMEIGDKVVETFRLDAEAKRQKEPMQSQRNQNKTH